MDDPLDRVAASRDSRYPATVVAAGAARVLAEDVRALRAEGVLAVPEVTVRAA